MLYFIPTPIGNLEDISLRSLNLLGRCEILFCEDTRVTKKLIHLLSEKFSIKTSIKKFISMHSHNEKEIISKLDKSIFEKNVAYLSDAGMPCISDPGCALVDFCQKNNIPYEVLPGPNALTLAYSASGFCESEFLFLGFLPHKGKDRENKLHQALFSGYVTILYESPHRLIKLVEQICNIDENRELFLIKEATKRFEEKFKGYAKNILKELKNKDIKGEWVVVLNSGTKQNSIITIDDIKSLDIPKKQMAKLLSKVTGESIKECYAKLI